MVKYLEEHGWKPIVLTVDPDYASYPGLDHTMLEEIPNTTDVYRTQSWDPYSMYATVASKKKDDIVSVGFVSDKKKSGWKDYMARWIRANVFIPDARRGWVPFALKQARILIQSQPIDALITTGPPQSTHLIGKSLKKHFNLPWIADMRDPWTKVYYANQFPTTFIAKHINQKMEQSVLDQADRIVTVTPSMQAAFQQQTQTPCINIFNGFDPADFPQSAPTPPTDSFLLAFVGNLMADQNPSVLWTSIQQARAENSMEKLKLLFVGNVDRVVLNSIEEAGLMDLVTLNAYVPHNEAVQFMNSSSALLLPINKGPAGKGILTGKLFEYLAARRPILGIGPTDGDAAHVLTLTGSGHMLDFDDKPGIMNTLLSYYHHWSQGTPAITINDAAIQQFNRKEQAKQMAALLDTLISDR